MKFWDSSAIVPLLVEEKHTDRLLGLYEHHPTLLVWWGTQVECASAIARLERGRALTPSAAERGFSRLQVLAESWHVVQPLDVLRQTAIRFVRVHPLRSADALQLAAAFAGSEGRPSSLEIVCLDKRLCEVARREGFPVWE